jgi:hypothetical protein
MSSTLRVARALLDATGLLTLSQSMVLEARLALNQNNLHPHLDGQALTSDWEGSTPPREAKIHNITKEGKTK